VATADATKESGNSSPEVVLPDGLFTSSVAGL
jgi:hypothetical protein